jgi:uncharacterized OB-fold protein
LSIALQVCTECGRINYPAREVCLNCLGEGLELTEISGLGALLSFTTLHASGAAFFRERLPWRIGSVLLDSDGAVVVAHLGANVNEIGQAVELRTVTLDGKPAFFADLPREEL